MRLTPPLPEIGETDGFTKENDLFELREFGERLANLVCRLDEPLVIALDGPWGSGKSTFVRQWAGLLRQRHVPVILFDAFANDHQEDAFISLAGEIAALANTTAGRNRGAVSKFIDNAKKAGRVLTPLAVKASIRAATLGVLAAEDLEGAQEFIKATGADTSAVTERLIEERLKQAEADRNTLEAFRQSLRVLAGQLGSAEPSAAAEADAGNPLVFIIDELDRCRPPFALNLLERVKHLFSVENVCFVLVSHLPQLEAVIKGSYGLDVDARTYLEKFFHIRVTLPEADPRAQNRTSKYVDHLWQVMGLNSGDPSYDDTVQQGLLGLGEVHNLSLRTLERVAAYIALVYAATSGQYFREKTLVVVLCMMKQINPDLFTKARSGTLEWQHATAFLRSEQWSDKRAGRRYEQWWRFVTGEDLLEDEQGSRDDWLKAIHKRLGDVINREKAVPLICAYIEGMRVIHT